MVKLPRLLSAQHPESLSRQSRGGSSSVMLGSVCSAKKMGRRIMGTLRRTKKLHLRLLVGSPPEAALHHQPLMPPEQDAVPWRQRVVFRTRMFNLMPACWSHPLHLHMSFPGLPSNHQAPDAHSCHVCV